MNIKDIPPHTLITGVAAIAWLGSFGLRAFNPEFALGPAADALMTTVVGYWFTAEKRGSKQADGSDLLGEVVNKVAIPMISKSNSPAQAPTPTAQPAARPTPPPTAPPPTTPPNRGLPWG